jgi:plastocyanin
MRSRPWALVLLLVLASCGGSSSSPVSGGGSTTTTTTTQPPAGLPTVTITSAGVSPKQVEIAVGGRVLFVNNDSVPHEMYSDPHPSHEECPPMNEVNVLARGQSRQTGAFNTARTCGFHDHGQSTNTALQGTIVIR